MKIKVLTFDRRYLQRECGVPAREARHICRCWPSGMLEIPVDAQGCEQIAMGMQLALVPWLALLANDWRKRAMFLRSLLSWAVEKYKVVYSDEAPIELQEMVALLAYQVTVPGAMQKYNSVHGLPIHDTSLFAQIEQTITDIVEGIQTTAHWAVLRMFNMLSRMVYILEETYRTTFFDRLVNEHQKGSEPISKEDIAIHLSGELHKLVASIPGMFINPIVRTDIGIAVTNSEILYKLSLVLSGLDEVEASVIKQAEEVALAAERARNINQIVEAAQKYEEVSDAKLEAFFDLERTIKGRRSSGDISIGSEEDKLLSEQLIGLWDGLNEEEKKSARRRGYGRLL